MKQSLPFITSSFLIVHIVFLYQANAELNSNDNYKIYEESASDEQKEEIREPSPEEKKPFKPQTRREQYLWLEWQNEKKRKRAQGTRRKYLPVKRNQGDARYLRGPRKNSGPRAFRSKPRARKKSSPYFFSLSASVNIPLSSREREDYFNMPDYSGGSYQPSSYPYNYGIMDDSSQSRGSMPEMNEMGQGGELGEPEMGMGGDMKGGGGMRGGGPGGMRGARSPAAVFQAMGGYDFSRSSSMNLSVSQNVPFEESRDDMPQLQTDRPPPPMGKMGRREGASTRLGAGLRINPTHDFGLNFNLSHTIHYDDSEQDSYDEEAAELGYEDAYGDFIRPTTMASVRANLRLSRITSLQGNISYGFNAGFMDPSAGVRFRFPLLGSRRLGQNLSASLSFQATAPLSYQSQEDGKVTTLSVRGGPTYRNKGFSLSLSGDLAGSIYRGEVQESDYYPYYDEYSAAGTAENTAVTADAMMPGELSRSPELIRMGANGSIGYGIVRQVSASHSLGVNTRISEDESQSTHMRATVISLRYSPGALSLSGNFSLSSRPSFGGEMESESSSILPDQPAVGFQIRYVFGGSARGRMGRGKRGLR